MGDSGARDARDRRLRVELETHRSRSLRRTIGRVTEEESQRDEMNEAIRAQRERGAVPRSMLPPEDESPPPRETVEAPEPPKRGLLARLLGR
jgi:hypothetical protein